jgi:hypothetical protein
MESDEGTAGMGECADMLDVATNNSLAGRAALAGHACHVSEQGLEQRFTVYRQLAHDVDIPGQFGQRAIHGHFVGGLQQGCLDAHGGQRPGGVVVGNGCASG